MKRTFIKGLILAAFAAVLASCFPDYEYMYTETGMCTLLSPTKLQTDNGDIFNITQNNSGGNIPDTLKRVMARCDVMTAVEGKSNEYNVRLMEFSGAFTQSPVMRSTMNPEAVGDNGINVNQAWVSGGYFNAFVNIPMLNPPKVDHEVNIVFDDIRSNSDTLYFEMRHNAHNECPENHDIPLNNFVFAGTYMSFPLDGILQQGAHPVCHLEWDWYDGDEYSFSSDKIRRSGNVTVQ